MPGFRFGPARLGGRTAQARRYPRRSVGLSVGRTGRARDGPLRNRTGGGTREGPAVAIPGIPPQIDAVFPPVSDRGMGTRDDPTPQGLVQARARRAIGYHGRPSASPRASALRGRAAGRLFPKIGGRNTPIAEPHSRSLDGRGESRFLAPVAPVPSDQGRTPIPITIRLPSGKRFSRKKS